MYNKQRLIELIRQKSLSFGEFRLASGQISNYYLDLSKVVMLYQGLHLITQGLYDLMEQERLFFDEFDCVGGPAMGAIPLVTALMLETEIERSFFVRKEIKEYGKLDVVEGNIQKGDKVLMIEDVTTTGGSLLKAIQAVEREGGVIKRLYSVLDREAGAVDFFAERGYELTSLLSVSEILESTDA